MENHCTVVRFSLRESKKNKQGLSPIEVSVSASGERIYFSTGKFARHTEWNKNRQAVRGNTQEAMLTNSFLAELRNRICKEEEALRQSRTAIRCCNTIVICV